MILNSRDKKSWMKGLHRMVWPTKSHIRTLQYFGKRILRIKATPHALAAGFATGIFAAFSPALGLHILMAIALAWTLGGNLIAAALGTAFANPLTFPFMIAVEYEVGKFVFGGQDKIPITIQEIGARVSHFDFEGTWEPLFRPLLTGSIVLGVVFALISYALLLFFARAYEAGRHQRKLQRGIIQQ